VKESKNSFIKVGAVIYRISVNGYSYNIKNISDWNKVVDNIKKGDYIGIFYYYNGVNSVFSFRYN